MIQQIRVPTAGYPDGLALLAHVVGCIAIHPTLAAPAHAQGWTITHIPTGRSLAQDVERLEDAAPAASRLADIPELQTVTLATMRQRSDLRDRVEAIVDGLPRLVTT